MSTEQNKAIVRQMVEEIFNRGNMSRTDEFLAPDFVEHEELPAGIPAGREGVKLMTTMFRSAFPDFKATIDDIIAEGDKVAIRMTWSGTHKGEFMGIPPTGKSVSFGVFDVVRMAGGKFVEHWAAKRIIPHSRADRSAAGQRPHDHKGFCAGRDRVGQGGVGRLVRPILLAGEEPDKRTPLLGGVVADRPAQHGILRLECVQDRPLRDRSLNLKHDLAAYTRQRAQMRGQHNLDHGSTWTSTDSTAGRSRTIGAQLSPELADAYTCPPVVPK
jgi:predicted ester cyclase